MIVVPLVIFSFNMNLLINLEDSTSIAFVGSSNKSISGDFNKALAILSFCLFPEDRFFVSLRSCLSKSKLNKNLSIFSSAFSTSATVAKSLRFS